MLRLITEKIWSLSFRLGTVTSENSSELNSEKESDVVSDTDDSSSERKRSKCITGATPKVARKQKWRSQLKQCV